MSTAVIQRMEGVFFGHTMYLNPLGSYNAVKRRDGQQVQNC